MIKVIVGGTEIQTTPIGWQDLTTTIRLDRELKGLFTVMDVSLTFIEDGYDLLRDNFDLNGYAYSQSVSILQQNDDGNYYPVFTGTLFYKDIEFSEGIEGASAKVQLTDNSFFAKIQNNKNLTAKPYVGLSKNGVAISPADYQIIRFFEPSTGNYYSLLGGYDRQDTGFKAYDILRFLVDFMSDGEVDFVSDTFGPGGVYEGTLLTCGFIPRFTSGVIGTGVTQELFELNFPDLSFYDVFTELNKLFNIGFVSGFNGARPYIRIEEYSYLFPENIIQDLSGVDKLKRKAASEYLYSKLSIGSEQIDNEPTLVSFPELIRFVGFNSEEYSILSDGQDRTLDLVNQWVLSSNIIEDLLVNAATVPTSWDNMIVVVNCEKEVVGPFTFWKAVKSNWIAVPAPYYYNEIYNNNNKAERYLGAVPSSIAAYLSNIDESFSAKSTTADPLLYNLPSNPYVKLKPDFEISDPASNYDPVNFRYVCTLAGVYNFQATEYFWLKLGGGGPNFLNLAQIVIRRESSGGSFISDTVIGHLNTSTAADGAWHHYSFSSSGNVVLDVGDRAYLYFHLQGQDCNFSIRENQQYSCIATSVGGGVYKTYDPKEYPIIRGQFDYPISLTEFRNIQSNPLGLFSYGVDGGKTYFGWIEELKYKHFKAASSFTLISNEKLR